MDDNPGKEGSMKLHSNAKLTPKGSTTTGIDLTRPSTTRPQLLEFHSHAMTC